MPPRASSRRPGRSFDDHDDDESPRSRFDPYASLARTQRDLATTVQALQETVQELALTVQAVRSQMPTQESIQREIEKRVDRDTYRVAHEALENEVRERARALSADIEEIKERQMSAWQRAAPWIAIAVSVLSVGVMAVMDAAGIAIALIHP